MKKILIVCFFLGCTWISRAQLVIGDIAFTGYNSDGAVSDEFSFIVLRAAGIPNGTIINFTDCGWRYQLTTSCTGIVDHFFPSNAGGANTETQIVWTATSDLSYGTQVRIGGLTATSGTVAGLAPNTTVPLSLANDGGDQIIAFQGTRANPTIIAGIHMNYDQGFTGASNWDDWPGEPAAGVGPNDSNRPVCLTNGVYSLFIFDINNMNMTPGTDKAVDNARLNPSIVISNDPAIARSQVNNSANWDFRDDNVPYSLPPGNVILPVRFTSIRAFEINNGIQLDWSVGIEENLQKYVVEKSSNGSAFSEIGSLPASGSNAYNFFDAQPFNGNNFYRVKAVDWDASAKYSTVIKVNLARGTRGLFAYPNPIVGRQFNLEINNLPAGSYQLVLISATGQVIVSKRVPHPGGSSTQSVSLSGESKGVFIVKLEDERDRFMLKVLVQ